MSESGSTATSDTHTLSYEQARDELVQVVNRLEQGGATLEESLQLWERGEALAARCEEWLLGARKRLEAARVGAAAEMSEREPATAGGES
jgi:exodeoxyribonuclease VII small subunit